MIIDAFLINAAKGAFIAILAWPFHKLAGMLPDGKLKFALLKQRGHCYWCERADAWIESKVKNAFMALFRLCCRIYRRAITPKLK